MATVAGIDSLVLPVLAKVLCAGAILDKESHSTKEYNRSIIGAVCCSNESCRPSKGNRLPRSHELKVAQMLFALQPSLSMLFFGTAD